MTLGDLKVGDRFRKWDGRTGVLIYLSLSRARIKLDGERKEVSFVSNGGVRPQEVNFVADGREVDLALGTTILEVLGHVDLPPRGGDRGGGEDEK